jgi:hypothetical protein
MIALNRMDGLTQAKGLDRLIRTQYKLGTSPLYYQDILDKRAKEFGSKQALLFEYGQGLQTVKCGRVHWPLIPARIDPGAD